MAKPKVALCTLGCKVNQNDSDAMLSSLIKAGYQEVSFGEKADVYIINTCTVTHLADRKSRQMIRRALKVNPKAVIAVTGCYAQTSPEDVLDLPGVKLVIGTKDRHRLPELLDQAKRAQEPLNVVQDIMKTSVFEEITGGEIKPHLARAYLKIQEGCNQFCTYCIIPYARGPMRSQSLNRTIEAAEELIFAGYQEIILTGIHTGAYGVDLTPQIDLSYLITKLIQLPGLKRLRISSIDPHEISDNLIDVMAGATAFCHHLHISLQSGDEEILRKMNRGYDPTQYENLVYKIRNKIPGIAITTDIMVGFPGETEEAFLHTYEFAEKIKFSGLHVFKYSPRKGTPAALFSEQVAPEIKEERSNRLIALGKRLLKEYAESYLGKIVEILVEQKINRDGQIYWEGHSSNYLHIVFLSEEAENDFKGRLVNVKLDHYQEGTIFGHLLTKGY